MEIRCERDLDRDQPWKILLGSLMEITRGKQFSGDYT